MLEKRLKPIKRPSKQSRVEYFLENFIAKKGLVAHALLPTEAKIQELTKVSLLTIRNAVNELVRKGLIYKHQGKGMFVAPPLRNKKILVITPEFSPSIADETTLNFYHQFNLSVQGMSASYETFLVSMEKISKLNLVDFESEYPQLSGVLFIRNHRNLIALKPLLGQLKIPIFFYGSDTFLSKLKSISFLVYEESIIMHAALDRLYKKGHRKIGFLAETNVVGPSEVYQQRFEIYCSWMKARRLKVNSNFSLVDIKHHHRLTGEVAFDQHREVLAAYFEKKNKCVCICLC